MGNIPHTVQGQIPNNLPTVTVAYTTHDEQTGQAIFHRPSITQSGLTQWHEPMDQGNMAFFTLYHTSTVPANAKNDLDQQLSLLNAPTPPPLWMKQGTICRLVDFAPQYSTSLHRSLSIDYGVVIEGTIELILDSGEVRTFHRGGMVVQRGTMHQWRNPSTENWTRMLFTLVAAEPRSVQGQALEEDRGGL